MEFFIDCYHYHTVVEPCKGESRPLHPTAIELVSDTGASCPLPSDYADLLDSFISISIFETVGLYLLPSASLPFPFIRNCWSYFSHHFHFLPEWFKF